MVPSSFPSRLSRPLRPQKRKSYFSLSLPPSLPLPHFPHHLILPISHSPAHALALEKLQAMADLINQTVGDAFSDLLFVEAILANKQWPLERWDQDYTDLPSRLVRVLVEDRSIFRTTMADTQLVTPAGLQEKIDAEIAKFSAGRAFVRPSGTEDVVRVYAEAATRAECDTLAWKVGGLVFDLAGGKGDRPSEFL